MGNRTLLILLLAVGVLAATAYVARQPGDGPMKKLISAVHGPPRGH